MTSDDLYSLGMPEKQNQKCLMKSIRQTKSMRRISRETRKNGNHLRQHGNTPETKIILVAEK